MKRRFIPLRDVGNGILVGHGCPPPPTPVPRRPISVNPTDEEVEEHLRHRASLLGKPQVIRQRGGGEIIERE